MAGPNVRVTRIRSDIAHAALTADCVLRPPADQSELSNVRNVKKPTPGATVGSDDGSTWRKTTGECAGFSQSEDGTRYAV